MTYTDDNVNGKLYFWRSIVSLHCAKISNRDEINKMLSYRRETALQAAL